MESTLGTQKRILLIEDDEFISDVYTTKFTREGFVVDRAMNGEEGLKKARANKPDIILLDLIMPVKNGFETLKELKADPVLRLIKVIVLSNLSQEEDRKEVQALGASDYCIKAEVSFSQMIEKIKLNLAKV